MIGFRAFEINFLNLLKKINKLKYNYFNITSGVIAAYDLPYARPSQVVTEASSTNAISHLHA